MSVLVEFTEECSIDVGRGPGEVERLLFAKGSVCELADDQAAFFLRSGLAKETKRRPKD